MAKANPFADIYKLCNSGSNEQKNSLIESGKLALPRYLDVELTNICNFECRFCPTGTKAMNRSKGFMPDDVVSALVGNVKKYHIPGVRFIRWGEPTLHPKYLKILKDVKSTGAIIHINTNGSKLDRAQIDQLIAMRLDSIKFSFQGADEKSYNEMRQGGDYQKLLAVLRLFQDVSSGGAFAPYIQISTTLTNETSEQVEQFKRNINGLCDYYNIGHTKLNHLDVGNMNISEAEKEDIKKLQTQESIHHVYRDVCNEAFDKLSLNWNGDVTLCCSDYDNFMIVGNILDMDLKQIFNSRIAAFYRSMILKKQHGNIKCCSTCYEVYEDKA